MMNAVSTAPAIANTDTATPVRPSVMMANTANALAPYVTPMMSGLASGLRAMLWKIAPDMPSAAPTSRPVSALGNRSRLTMNSVARSPPPNSVFTTSMTGILKSPSDSETQKATKTSTARTTITASERACRTARARRDDLNCRQRGHRSASFRRRTSAMKNGAPMTAVTMPTCSSPGWATTRPRTSEPSSRIGASSIEYGRIQR